DLQRRPPDDLVPGEPHHVEERLVDVDQPPVRDPADGDGVGALAHEPREEIGGRPRRGPASHPLFDGHDTIPIETNGPYLDRWRGSAVRPRPSRAGVASGMRWRTCVASGCSGAETSAPRWSACSPITPWPSNDER